MWILRWILIILCITIILYFALMNQTETVSVKFLIWKTPVLPLYFFLFLSYIAGIATWFVFSIFNIFKLKRTNSNLQRTLRKTKEELNRLRNVNIEDEIETTPSQKEPTPDQDEDATTLESTS